MIKIDKYYIKANHYGCQIGLLQQSKSGKVTFHTKGYFPGIVDAISWVLKQKEYDAIEESSNLSEFAKKFEEEKQKILKEITDYVDDKRTDEMIIKAIAENKLEIVDDTEDDSEEEE